MNAKPTIRICVCVYIYIYMFVCEGVYLYKAYVYKRRDIVRLIVVNYEGWLISDFLCTQNFLYSTLWWKNKYTFKTLVITLDEAKKNVNKQKISMIRMRSRLDSAKEGT